MWRIVPGNFTFVVMTDRDALDEPLYKPFVSRGAADEQMSRASWNTAISLGATSLLRPTPTDTDIVVVMRNDFDVQACDGETRGLFDRLRAAEVFGASMFWVRPAIFLETLEEFMAHWQIKRHQTHRDIVAVRG